MSKNINNSDSSLNQAAKTAFPAAAALAFCLVGLGIVHRGGLGGDAASAAPAVLLQGTIPATSALTQNFSVLNGFGVPLLPYRIAKPDSGGNATPQVVEIRSLKTLVDNKPSAINPVLPVATWPSTAILPSQKAGNHFLLIKFGKKFIPDEKSILSVTSPDGLTGALSITAQDPVSGVQTPIPGRVFVNGRSVVSHTVPKKIAKDCFTIATTEIVTWVKKGFKVNQDSVVCKGNDPNNPGTKITLTGPALPPDRQEEVRKGFPGLVDAANGIDNSFSGSKDLLGAGSVVFIPDADDDLSTFETFPTGKNIRVSVGTGVRSKSKAYWPAEAIAVSTVSTDALTPEVLVNPGSFTPVIDPALASEQVPVDKKVTISFTEPVQPYTVGPLPSDLPPPVAGGVILNFTVGQKTVSVPFTVLPQNAYNFTKITLTPAFQFPGSFYENGPNGLASVNDVVFTINVNITTLGAIRDLSNLGNSIPRASTFKTAPGVGIVNAPVSPSVTYLGFGGQTPGVGVLDLDGFGQGTGTPIQDDLTTLAIEANTTNFPNNPDLFLGSSPPLSVEFTPLAGGSLGPLTLSRDSSTVNFVFAQPPILGGVRDIAIGGPLDQVFNNGVCLSGGGNYCAKDIFHTTAGNAINVSPAPNPPKLIFPPLCLQPILGAEEPHNSVPPNPNPGSWLVSGNFLGDKAHGIPPQGLFTDSPPPNFGSSPSPPPTQLPVQCGNYSHRQQIGHFLYVIDPVVRRVVVLNSNRMTLVASIPQPDPVDLAISPDLKILAISNFSTNQLQFVNTDPLSVDFHKIVQTTNVGLGPLGICFEPDGEDIFVANSLSNTISVLNGQSRKVRKTVSNQLNQPFQVVCTSRQLNFGFQTGVYFAYVLNKNGTVAIYESGPSGVQGIGFDDLVGVVTDTFPTPTSIQAETDNFNSAVWILHRNNVGQPKASNLALAESPTGPLPFVQFFFFPVPSFRQRNWKVVRAVESDQISGFAPRDLAFDDTLNIANLAVANLISETGAGGFVVAHSSKRHVRFPNGAPAPAVVPKAMFLANFDTGKIDVISLATLQRIVSPVDAPGVSALCHYWRQ